MTAFASGHTLGRLLCDALDLDPSLVKRIQIDCASTDMATVLVTYGVRVGPDTKVEEITGAVRQYELRERDL